MQAAIILALWAIAIGATAFLAPASFTYLGPLFALCAIGSVFTLRRGQQKSG